jgi:hypothetical protein
MENLTLPLQAPGVDSVQQIFGQYWWLLIVLVLWTIIWKGIALWKAARNESKVWFVIMLIVNTVGILEIIYIFAVANRNKQVSAQN